MSKEDAALAYIKSALTKKGIRISKGDGGTLLVRQMFFCNAETLESTAAKMVQVSVGYEGAIWTVQVIPDNGWLYDMQVNFRAYLPPPSSSAS